MIGRKRKSRHRRPCGKLEPEKRPDDRLRVAEQPHRRDLPEALRADERAESALGRCMLRREITQAEYDAGTRFAVVVGEYRVVIEAPRHIAGSGRGFGCYPELCRAMPGACHCTVRRDRYCRAYQALEEAGKSQVDEVVHVAIDGREPANLARLRQGLASLAWHFGYGADERSGRDRRTV